MKTSEPVAHLLSLPQLVELRERAAREQRRVVLTNGCFDILHRGHLEYLHRSAALGDLLVVAINSDHSVRQLKGAGRPVHAEVDRALAVASLRCVDHVFIFPGPRLHQEIRLLRPDVYTKAGDYTLETLDAGERLALQDVGSDIQLLPFVAGHSTTRSLASVQTTAAAAASAVAAPGFGTTVDEAVQTLHRCHRLTADVEQAGEALIACLRRGNKVLTCGNGGSAADALHLAEELVGRYRGERRSLPAVCLNADVTALTCIANDYGFDNVFSRCVEGLSVPGDLLVCFTTSGRSPNVLRAMRAAADRSLQTIVLTGRDGGDVAGQPGAIIVPSDSTARIQEVHTLILHHWLELVEAVDWTVR